MVCPELVKAMEQSMRRTDGLDRLLLSAVGDDFVTLESIVERVSCSDGPVFGKLDPESVYGRLLTLVADKLINAYLLHADPPYITQVSANPGCLPTSWFYITQRGRKCLANVARRRVPLQRRDTDSPGKEYRPAVNF
jgi:hypothetical protein